MILMNMFVDRLRYFKILHSVCTFLNLSFTLLKGDRIDEFVVGATKSPFVVTGKALLMRESNILPDFVYATYLYHFSVYYIYHQKLAIFHGRRMNSCKQNIFC